MNDAHNLGVRAPAPEEKQTPSSPPSFAGVLRRPGLGKDRVWVSEAPNPGPAGSASIKLLREVCSRFQAGASPGQGRGPRHLLGAKALRPRPLPGPPPPPRVAHTAGARVTGWCPGGLASPPPTPASLGCSWPSPSGHSARTSSRARHHPAWNPSGRLPARPAFPERRRGIRAPRIPEPDADRRTRPSPAAHGPFGPGPGARPWPGGPVLRTRGGARPLTRGALTHRPRSSSPLASPPPAVLAARRSPPRPGAHSSGPGPGTRGSSARRAWRAPARRARSAGPRARAREPGGGGAKLATRLEAALDK